MDFLPISVMRNESDKNYLARYEKFREEIISAMRSAANAGYYEVTWRSQDKDLTAYSDENNLWVNTPIVSIIDELHKLGYQTEVGVLGEFMLTISWGRNIS